MKKLLALSLSCGALALSACTSIPECSDSMDLDCNIGAYSEERTWRADKPAATNINKPPAEPVFVQPAPPMTEPVPAPAPEPVDTQVMRRVDQTPAIKSLK